MARCLIIGCGCRGQALARALAARGHAVRGTTRDPGRRGPIETAGAEAVIADPDRTATVAPALEQVSAVYLLLGSAHGSVEQLTALHGERLDMLLGRLVDTPVRAVMYEARGAVDHAVLHAGSDRVSAFCEDSQIPYALLTADPADYKGWLDAAVGALDRVLGSR